MLEVGGVEKTYVGSSGPPWTRPRCQGRRRTRSVGSRRSREHHAGVDGGRAVRVRGLVVEGVLTVLVPVRAARSLPFLAGGCIVALDYPDTVLVNGRDVDST